MIITHNLDLSFIYQYLVVSITTTFKYPDFHLYVTVQYIGIIDRTKTWYPTQRSFDHGVSVQVKDGLLVCRRRLLRSTDWWVRCFDGDLVVILKIEKDDKCI